MKVGRELARGQFGNSIAIYFNSFCESMFEMNYQTFI